MSPGLRRPLMAVAAASIVCVGGSMAVATVSAQGGPLRWAKAAPFPQPEEELYGTVVNGKLYVFGGCLKGISGEGGTQNSWEYDPTADTWRALAQLPVKRCSAIAEEVGGKIYLIGGLEPLENGRGTRVTGLNQMYDPATDTWTNRSPMPTTRNHAFSGAVNGKIYVIGGRLGAGNIPATTNIDTVEEYDPATNLWGAVKERMPTARSGGGYTVCNGRIFAGGGEWITRELFAAFKALEAFDPVTNTWQVMPSLPGAVHGNAMGCIGNKLHTVSGKMRGGGPSDAQDPATASHDVLELPQVRGTR